jgi:protein involved in polysaccharide export with SLBB domain
MRTRPGFASRLLFRPRAGKLRPLSILAIAVFTGSAAYAQTHEPAQSAGGPTAPPISSFLDSTRRAANPQTSPQTAPALPPSISAPSGYQLSVDDQIAVEVFGEDDLRTAARVNSEGAVSLPLLGSVKLAGLTLNNAAARLTELYGRDYLVNPKVNVTLITYAKRRFTVLGQVNRPGSYEMPEGSPSGIDLLEAIAIAGGYTRIAAPERISVKRRDQVMRVDAKRIARRGGSEGGFRVEPGDTITVGESIF